MNCSDCPIGYFTSTRDYSTCMICPRGYFAKDTFVVTEELNNRSSCASCLIARYGLVEGAHNESSCKNCIG